MMTREIDILGKDVKQGSMDQTALKTRTLPRCTDFVPCVSRARFCILSEPSPIGRPGWANQFAELGNLAHLGKRVCSRKPLVRSD